MVPTIDQNILQLLLRIPAEHVGDVSEARVLAFLPGYGEEKHLVFLFGPAMSQGHPHLVVPLLGRRLVLFSLAGGLLHLGEGIGDVLARVFELVVGLGVLASIKTNHAKGLASGSGRGVSGSERGCRARWLRW